MPAIYDGRWAELVVDTNDQLEVLADLLANGLISPEEFERQKAKTLEW